MHTKEKKNPNSFQAYKLLQYWNIINSWLSWKNNSFNMFFFNAQGSLFYVCVTGSGNFSEQFVSIFTTHSMHRKCAAEHTTEGEYASSLDFQLKSKSLISPPFNQQATLPYNSKKRERGLFLSLPCIEQHDASDLRCTLWGRLGTGSLGFKNSK